MCQKKGGVKKNILLFLSSADLKIRREQNFDWFGNPLLFQWDSLYKQMVMIYDLLLFLFLNQMLREILGVFSFIVLWFFEYLKGMSKSLFFQLWELDCGILNMK